MQRILLFLTIAAFGPLALAAGSGADPGGGGLDGSMGPRVVKTPEQVAASEYKAGLRHKKKAWKQEGKFGRHTDLAFGNPNWELLAKSFGWHGHFVRNAADLKDELEAAFNEQGPSLVVIPIDYRENQLLTKKLGEIQCAI